MKIKIAQNLCCYNMRMHKIKLKQNATKRNLTDKRCYTDLSYISTCCSNAIASKHDIFYIKYTKIKYLHLTCLYYCSLQKVVGYTIIRTQRGAWSHSSWASSKFSLWMHKSRNTPTKSKSHVPSSVVINLLCEFEYHKVMHLIYDQVGK
jgi:hypothetical protein